jgi:CDGSH-type Zn-finger protein
MYGERERAKEQDHTQTHDYKQRIILYYLKFSANNTIGAIQQLFHYSNQMKTTQTLYSLCGCKYTRSPPYCDATHISLELNPTKPPCTCDTNNKLTDNW